MKAIHEVWREFAGAQFDELMRNQDSAFEHLNSPNKNVRIAAINICDFVWHASTKPEFVAACRRIAESDPDVAVRIHGIEAYGRAMESTRDPLASRFLANLVKDTKSPDDVRRAAYWALREVQWGVPEVEHVQRLAGLMRSGLRRNTTALSEEQIKSILLGGGRYPEALWDSAEQIDWALVDRCASQ
jgi:hypothetical protein